MKEGVSPVTSARYYGPIFLANTCCGALTVKRRLHWPPVLLNTNVLCVMQKYRKSIYFRVLTLVNLYVNTSLMIMSSHLWILITDEGKVFLILPVIESSDFLTLYLIFRFLPNTFFVFSLLLCSPPKKKNSQSVGN